MPRTTRAISYSLAGTVVVLRPISFVIESAVKGLSGTDTSTEACCPVPVANTAFRRIIIDNQVTGGARVTWELQPEFYDQGPHTFYLQASPSGVIGADDWTVVGGPAIDPSYLVSGDQLSWGMEEIVHFRVVLITPESVTYLSEPTRASTVTDLRDWLIVQEIARKEVIRQSLLTGANGYLLKAKRFGIRCHCVNSITRERGDSACLTCYGVGIVGGYHPPVPCYLAELSPHESRQHTSYAEGRATTHDIVFAARVVPGLPVVQEDVWVAAGDDARYYIHKVWVNAKHRGIPIIQAAEFRRAPRSDVLYKVVISAPTTSDCEWGLGPEDEAAVEVCFTTETCE
jgi:hypothetical protein